MHQEIEEVLSGKKRGCVVAGDCIEVMKQMPDECVQCVVCSPPYLQQRDYQVEGQIGLEDSVDEYINKLVEVFREVRRILRKDGILWVNIANCYATTVSGSVGNSGIDRQMGDVYTRLHNRQYGHGARKERIRKEKLLRDYKPKDLIPLAWLLGIALRKDGWWLRSDVIWEKPNPVPEQMLDRPTKSHEYVLQLAKSSQCFYDGVAVMEDSVDPESYKGRSFRGRKAVYEAGVVPGISGVSNRSESIRKYPKRCRRDVWVIPVQGYKNFYAAFPERLPELCILAGTSEKGCCLKCGAPWERVIEHSIEGIKTVGWQPTCSCGIEDTLGCVVLDPFMGSGTTGVPALKLGRRFIGIDLNREYVKMAFERLRKVSPLFGDVMEVIE